MDQLINYLLEFGTLNPQQIALIKRLVVPIELKKRAYFSEAGQTARRVAFVEEGVLRVCYYTKQGNEVTRYFVDENTFAVDLTSFNEESIKKCGALSLNSNREGLFLTQQKPGYHYRK